LNKYYLILAVISYLLGSIPFGYILVKLFLKQDIRATGSGNIGATNVARSGAKGLAVATLVLDALKGAIAVLYAIAMHEEFGDWNALQAAMALAALLAVLGHMFPIWLGFKGGKGVATGVGSFLILAPASVGITLVLFFAVVGLTRYVSLGSIIASAAFPFLACFVSGISGPALILMAACSLLIILKHHENIRRLLAGSENKFGGKKSVPPPEAMEKQA
jgi:acyl phosphate:glycerol-3-phosphate acyltransferase